MLQCIALKYQIGLNGMLKPADAVQLINIVKWSLHSLGQP